MNRRSFLGGMASGALLYAFTRRAPAAPLASGIHYADPRVIPASTRPPAGWIEHHAPHPSPSAAYRWVDVILEASAREITRTGAPRPTVLSRYMAIACTAMYDAWAAYDRTAVGTRLGGALRRPASEHTERNKMIAIGHATHRALVDQMPADAAWLGTQARALGVDPDNASRDPSTPVGVGNLAAAALAEYRRRDGANQLGDEVGSNGTPYSDYTYYEPRNPVGGAMKDLDRWQPITFDDGKGGHVTPGFLTPHWYHVKPLALDRSDQFRPTPQPRVGSKQLEREVDEVIAFNGGLSLEQKSIVEFMRDGPRSTGQSGHWLELARDVSRRDRNDLDRDVKMFFCVANASFEAFIAAWDAKRYFDSARPFALVRMVQTLYAGQAILGYLGPGKGFGTLPAESWHPYSPGTFVTPPFPGYVSGHSSVSSACGKMLELFTGSDKLAVYHHHTAGMYTEPEATAAEMQAVNGTPAVGLPADKHVLLKMPTFSATADMAGLSRVMGGYHIQSDNVAGLKLGRGVAEFVWPRYRALFDGTAKVRA